MAPLRSITFLVAVTTLQSVLAAEELTPERFKELTTSGKNGMIKFYQPWCGHCTKMKPDWDQLALEAHPSVFIADINCSEQEELCSENAVQGYPTIKIYKGADNVEDYKGGRTLSALAEFVDAELAVKCDVTDPVNSGCSEKAMNYITKWTSKNDVAAVKKELDRLVGMSSQSMKADLKQWLNERIAILRQITDNCNVDKPEATCSEKAAEFIGKWKDKEVDVIRKELDRLVGMTSDVMTTDLKEWLRERIAILKQFGRGSDEL